MLLMKGEKNIMDTLFLLQKVTFFCVNFWRYIHHKNMLAYRGMISLFIKHNSEVVIASEMKRVRNKLEIATWILFDLDLIFFTECNSNDGFPKFGGGGGSRI